MFVQNSESYEVLRRSSSKVFTQHCEEKLDQSNEANFSCYVLGCSHIGDKAFRHQSDLQNYKRTQHFKKINRDFPCDISGCFQSFSIDVPGCSRFGYKAFTSQGYPSSLATSHAVTAHSSGQPQQPQAHTRTALPMRCHRLLPHRRQGFHISTRPPKAKSRVAL